MPDPVAAVTAAGQLPLSPTALWVAEHWGPLCAALVGTGTAAAALKRWGTALLAAGAHAGLAHNRRRTADLVIGVLDDDSRAAEPRMRAVNNRTHEADVRARIARMDAQAEQLRTLEQQVRDSGTSINNELQRQAERSVTQHERLNENLERLNGTLERVGERLDAQSSTMGEHAVEQGKTATRVESLSVTVTNLSTEFRAWREGDVDRRVAEAQHPVARSRGGSRETDPDE